MSILDSLNPFKEVADVVAIYDENMTQLFTSARMIKADIKESAQVMTHPVETGETITDDKIILPVEIDLAIIFDAKTHAEGYKQIKQAFIDSTIISLQTRVDTYPDLIISDYPHREDAEMYDTITMNLRLKEIKFVTAQFATLPPRKVSDKKDASTANRGTLTATQSNAATTEKATSGTILSSVGRYFGL